MGRGGGRADPPNPLENLPNFLVWGETDDSKSMLEGEPAFAQARYDPSHNLTNDGP
jgi:hypothetical protein